MAARVATVDRRGYAAYIRSAAWTRKKKEFRLSKRCKHRCSKCGEKDAPLDIHHLTYERLGNELVTDLIELCRACHWITHKEQELAAEPKKVRSPNRKPRKRKVRALARP